MPFGLGSGEILLICVVMLVVFGSTKLPQLGDGLGRAIKNFKRAMNSSNEIDVTPKKPELSGGKTENADDKSAAK